MARKSCDLPAIEIAQRLHEQREVVLLAPHGGRRRVIARRGEIDAVGRTVDLGQPLGSAADSTDLIADRRTRAARLPDAAERTKHSRALLYNPAKIRESSSERALHCPEKFREGVPVWAKRCFDRSRPSSTSRSSSTAHSHGKVWSRTTSPRSTSSTFSPDSSSGERVTRTMRRSAFSWRAPSMPAASSSAPA